MTLSLHPTYYDKNVRKQIATAYKANPLPSVQLQGFLEPKTYALLEAAVKKAKWTPDVVADRYSRHIAKLPKETEKMFASKEFAAFVREITGSVIKGKPRLERYVHRDYTLRNDEQRPPGLFLYFDMTPFWNPKVGGATIISNSVGELARVQPIQNTLVLVDCSRAWPFLQYINHYAEKNVIIRVTWA